MNRCFVTTIVAAITLTFASFSIADVVDGDFEATGMDAGWTYKGAPNNADQDASAPGIDVDVEGNETLFISGNFLNTPIWNLSHKRGTEMNSVGLARRRSSTKVSNLSAKKMCVPL